MDGGELSLDFYINRTLMRINELDELLKNMRRVARNSDRSNVMKSRISIVEQTLESNLQLLNALTHWGVLPKLLH